MYFAGLLGAGYVALFGVQGSRTTPVIPAAPPMSGQQVLERSRIAYGALQSYSGVSKVSVVSTLGGKRSTFNTQATVQFSRQNHLRVEGTAMIGGKFAFITDGRTTWGWASYMGDQWQPMKTPEMAIARFTGISYSASTTIPAILLNTQWGNPFLHLRGVSLKPATETIGGHPTWRVEAAERSEKKTYWVDQKTLLLVKLRRRTEGRKLGSLSGVGNMTGSSDSIETFVDVKINGKLPGDLFNKPAAAPR